MKDFYIKNLEIISLLILKKKGEEDMIIILKPFTNQSQWTNKKQNASTIIGIGIGIGIGMDITNQNVKLI